MCGRFTLKTPVMHWLDDLFPNWSTDVGPSWTDSLPSTLREPRYNIAPSQWIAVVRMNTDGTLLVQPMRWGLLPPWADSYSVGYSMINARSETIHEKPSFRPSLIDKRCVILADGYYEWRKLDAKTKQPFWIHRPHESMFAMAGLWSKNYKIPELENKNGPLLSATIITTPSNADTCDVHDRMPAIFRENDLITHWLDPNYNHQDFLETLQHQLTPLAEGSLQLRAVTSRVNSPKNEGSTLIEPDE